MWQPAQSTKLPDFGAGAAKMRRGGGEDLKQVPSGAPSPRRRLFWGSVWCLAALEKRKKKKSKK